MKCNFIDSGHLGMFSCPNTAVLFYVNYNVRYIEGRCTSHVMPMQSVERFHYDTVFETYEDATAALAMQAL